jgi:hypothetical protein
VEGAEDWVVWKSGLVCTEGIDHQVQECSG